jgi:hypothetical protein
VRDERVAVGSYAANVTWCLSIRGLCSSTESYVVV